MAADALAPSIMKSSRAIVLPTSENEVVEFREEVEEMCKM